jgi:hypothetical protein
VQFRSPNAIPSLPSTAPYALSTWHAEAVSSPEEPESEQMFRAYLRERRGARRTRGTRQEGSAGGSGEALRRVHRARAGRESRTHLFGNADVGLKLTSSASATGTPRRAPPARSTRTARIARVERIGADAASRDGGVRGAELAKAQRFENRVLNEK